MSYLKEELNKLIAEPNEPTKYIKLEDVREMLTKLWCIEHPNSEEHSQAFQDFGYMLFKICIDNISFDELRDESYGEYLDWLLVKFNN